MEALYKDNSTDLFNPVGRHSCDNVYGMGWTRYMWLADWMDRRRVLDVYIWSGNCHSHRHKIIAVRALCYIIKAPTRSWSNPNQSLTKYHLLHTTVANCWIRVDSTLAHTHIHTFQRCIRSAPLMLNVFSPLSLSFFLDVFFDICGCVWVTIWYGQIRN